MDTSRFSKYAWIVLGYTIIVILWGAYVRATGSGAGCGSHWPLCNGEVIPRSDQVETLIEFTHRLMSGVSLILVLILFFYAFRLYPSGHPVRLGSSLSLLFIITEALVGAGLVLFEWVASDISSGRVISMAIHLINTFLLLAAITLTAWWVQKGSALDLSKNKALSAAFVIGFFGVLVIGVSGAVNALGDTLFPVESISAGIEQDFNPTAHLLLRLRIWHPIVAILVGFYLLLISGLLAMFQSEKLVRVFAITLSTLIIVQLIAGMINLLFIGTNIYADSSPFSS